MKKIVSILALATVMFASCNSKTPEENLKNVEKVSMGQSYDEVIDIMGSPQKNYDISNDAFCISYPVPEDRADDIKLIFRKKDNILVFISYIGGQSKDNMQSAPTRKEP